ncbi:MAG TPA: dihydrodipicolinate synthase family protein [Verrucomicrobiota bacterium]|nr:dihydrodipicolinate synthase family protein [Verrucomicrobiota bacterium]
MPVLSGIIPPLVTPLRGRDELDLPGLERLLEHVLAGGVHGLFILGSTGEGPGLGYALRRELITRVCAQVAGRVPVLVGITDSAFTESLAIARHAAEAGAAAVVAAPPFYFPAGQPELSEWIDHLVAALPLPLTLYNMPALTKVALAPETLRRAMDHPRIVGLKDSSGDLGYFRELVALRRQRPDWSILIGPEEKLAGSLALGGDGGVCGGANLFPRLHVELAAAFQAGDPARVDALQAQVMRVSEALYHVGSYSSAWIKGLKCALSCAGLCDDFMAEPAHRFRAPERARIAAALERLQAEVTAAVGR